MFQKYGTEIDSSKLLAENHDSGMEMDDLSEINDFSGAEVCAICFDELYKKVMTKSDS